MTNRTIRTILATMAGMALLFWLGDKTGWQVRTDLAGGMTWVDAADRFWLDLQRPLHFSVDRADLLCGLAFCGLGLLAWAYHASTRLATRPGEEHGSAKWGKPGDIAPFTDRQPERNLTFTRTERLGLDTRRTQRNLNVLVLGSSGSGKTRSYVKPNLLAADMNFACTDPKGELKRDTEQAMQSRGYETRTLDLIHLDRSDGFNPMRYLDPVEPEPSILRLVDNIITNTTGDRKDSDGFWERAERALLTALIAWVYYTEDGTTTDPDGTIRDNMSLTKAVDMVSLMQASEEDETRESIIDAQFAEAHTEAENARAHPEQYDRETLRMLDGLAFACTQYRTFTQGAGETKKSIIISLGVRLAPLQIRQVRDILDHDQLDLHSLDEGKRVIYLETSDTDGTFGFLAAVFYQSLFEILIRKADSSPDGTLGRDVHCMLDEFANIGKIPNLTRLIATIRSRHISASIILQTYSQGKALYKDDWETIAGNCDSQLFLGGNEKSTTEYISERLGNQTIDIIETSESKGTNGSHSTSIRKNQRALLDRDELGRLPTNQCIYLLRGVRPFISKKIISTDQNAMRKPNPITVK